MSVPRYLALIDLRLRSGLALEAMQMERILGFKRGRTQLSRIRRMDLFTEVVDVLIQQNRGFNAL